MKMIIKRELTRPPAGKFPGIIYDWNIEEKTSQRGIPYHALILSIMILVNDQLMNVYYTIPLFWNTGDPMYVLCNTLGVLPELHEDFDSDILLGKPIDVMVRENTFNGRTYSNVVHIDLLRKALPNELTIWMEQRDLLVSVSNSIFDDEGEVDKKAPQIEIETPEKINDQPQHPVQPFRKRKIFPTKTPQQI